MRNVLLDLTKKYSMDELAGRSGFCPRTIRLYIERGLLPGSHGRGRGAGYDQKHLFRLLLIKNAKDKAHLTLEHIRSLMTHLSERDIQAFAMERKSLSSLYQNKETQMHEPQRAVSTRSTWVTIELPDGVQLRQSGVDPAKAERLERIADKVTAWIKEEELAT